MLSVITALEFFQHYFSEMGHRDLLVTQNLSQAIKQPTLSYLTRSVRRRAATSKRFWVPQPCVFSRAFCVCFFLHPGRFYRGAPDGFAEVRFLSCA